MREVGSIANVHPQYQQLKFTLLEQSVRIVFQVATLLVVARALEAPAFGAAAVVTGLMNFFYMIGQLGVEAAVIRSNLTKLEIRNVTSWLLLVNVFLGAVLIVSAVFLASGAKDATIRLCLAAGLGLPAWAAGAVPRAKLTIERRFGVVAFSGIVGSAVNLVTALILLRQSSEGFVPVAASSVAIAAASIVCCVFGRQHVGVTWPHRLPRDLVEFMRHMFAFNVINYVSRNGDTLLIAGILGTAAAGVYDRAYALMMYPMTAASLVVGRVSYLWFVDACLESKASGDLESIDRAFERSERLVISLSIPALTAVAVLADQLCSVLFLDSLQGAGQILRVLAVGAVAQSLQAPTGLLLQSVGNTRTLYRRGGAISALTLVFVLAGVLIGGITGAAAALTLYSWASLPLVLGLVRAHLNEGAGRIMRGLLPDLCVATGIAGGVATLWRYSRHLGSTTMVLLALLSSVVAALLAQALLRRTRPRQILGLQ